jgi:ElaB/YqjD/DUF883 family membrane-anchored ribosome-binding protein
MRTYEKYAGNGADGEQSAREIERDLEQIRGEMRQTLTTIEERLSGRRLIEQVTDRFGDEPSEMISNLGRAIGQNPIPLLLIGAGVAMLWRAEGTPARRQEGGDGDARLDEAKGAARDAAERTRDAAKDASERTRDAAKDAASRASGAAREAAGRVGETGRRVEKRARRWAQEQPLVLIGFGLALGALAGAGLPTTRREKEIAGGEAQRLAERAERVR